MATTDDTSSPNPLEAAAALLRERFLHRPFGAIRFWRFAVVRPFDQSFELVSVQADGDRLDLTLVHASLQGLPGVLSVWAPEGLSITAQGLTLHNAARLKLDENEAWSSEGGRYGIRTPRGEGAFDINGADALTLEL